MTRHCAAQGLPISELPGVGGATERKLAELGIKAVSDLQASTVLGLLAELFRSPLQAPALGASGMRQGCYATNSHYVPPLP
jgi:nucleotidyltransferase/DNA polymerase involved in DNA repair